MRRRLNLLVLAVTGLVVVAFLVPLGALVRRQADQQARIRVERDVQTIVTLITRELAAGRSMDELGEAVSPLTQDVSLVLPDGRIYGTVEPDPELVEAASAAGRAQSTYTDRGWELAVPVLTASGDLVVYGLAPRESLTAGVARAWLLLGALGVGLTLVALAVADRLGRTLVGPSRRIAAAAHRLGEGDLDTRVAVEGPPEMTEIARAFNRLAARLRDLLAAEREAVADLSHRLRTPLTAVRLEVDRIPDPEAREAVLAQVERLGRAVDELIREARRRPEGRPTSTDLAQVVAERVAFWRVLAEEQDRPLTYHDPGVPVPVVVDRAELAAALDVLIDNVFTHTPPGTGFGVEVVADPPSVVVTDQGPGFPEGFDPVRRGESGGGSTGLGLDIARRVAEAGGGRLTVESPPAGGARVRMELRGAG